MKKSSKALIILIFFLLLVFTISCAETGTVTDKGGYALVHGRLVDGNGGEPVEDSLIVVSGDTIEYSGAYDKELIPSGCEVMDVSGMTVLPGFINSHVHNAYDEDHLAEWAIEGVTTVRDEGIIYGRQWEQTLASRKGFDKPELARIVSACPMMGLEGGYCNYVIDSADDAVKMVNTFIDAGIDVIKISRENGIEGRTDMAVLPEEIYTAIIRAAHARGIPVSAHITKERFLKDMLDAGVDDIAHICFDAIYSEDIELMIEKDIYLVPTLSVYRHYGELSSATRNLRKIVEAGGKVAMGNDYADVVAQFGYETGMPVEELLMMQDAGMTPMQVIVASTKNGAHVCNMDDEIGSLEAGKLADIILVQGNPLEDLSLMGEVSIVIKGGVIINDERSS